MPLSKIRVFIRLPSNFRSEISFIYWSLPSSSFALLEFLEFMFCFLCKTVPFRRHIISSVCPSTLQQLLCVQNQWLSVRYCSSNASHGHSFTVSYLINLCGFSQEEAASASKLVSFESREKPDLVIKFLENQGFSQTQIFGLVRNIPEVLRLDPEKNLLPKIEFFKSRGVLSSDIPRLISSCPSVLKRSLRNQLIPSFDFFRNLFQSNDKFIKVLKEYAGILLDINTHAVPNMKLLREVGVPESNVMTLLKFFPRTLTKNPVRFKEIVKELTEMGFNPLRFNFVLAINVLASLSKSTWTKKADVYKKWGWSDNDILAAFGRYPFCMKASEDKINAVMEFLVNKLGCESSTIATYPIVLGMSLNKRIVPRGSVIQVLLSKGLVEKETLMVLFTYTESVFMTRFILPYEKEASELLKLYQDKLDFARGMKTSRVLRHEPGIKPL